MTKHCLDERIVMAIRNIYLDGDPILRKKCRPVEKFDEKLATLIDDMHETLDKADGAGLAAPQVGICRRLFIMHIDREDGTQDRVEAVNPEIIAQSGDQYVLEGCLSIPDKWGYVDRPEKVTLRAYDREGNVWEREFEGLGAQCAAHESAHLEGELFTDIAKEILTPEQLKAMQEEGSGGKRRRKGRR